MVFFHSAFPFAVLLLTSVSNAQQQSRLSFFGSDPRTRCREFGRGPHMEGLWQNGFPDDTGFDSPQSLCEGTVIMADDNSICTIGRVTYDQIAAVTEPRGRFIRAPAATDITVPGHIIAGSGNVVLGSEAKLLYDFVANYTIGGVTYAADKATMTDNLLVASRGLVDGVCFTADFSQPESFYSISHDFWFPSSSRVDFARAATANILYFGYASAVAEYHVIGDEPFLTGHTQLALITFVAGIVPAFAFNALPFLGLTGVFRLFTRGTMSTARFPQPLDAPAVTVEDVQINTEWTAMIAAAENGLFLDGEQRVPLFLGVFIKRIEPSTNGCWDVAQAAIDIQAPQGWGGRMDEYVNDVVLPGTWLCLCGMLLFFCCCCRLTFLFRTHAHAYTHTQPCKPKAGRSICIWANASTRVRPSFKPPWPVTIPSVAPNSTCRPSTAIIPPVNATDSSNRSRTRRTCMCR